MALPVFVKTWRFGANLVIPSGATELESNRLVWWAIFNALRGRLPDNSGAIPWTDSTGAAASAPSDVFSVTGSCDSVNFGNNDNVNHITALSDVVWGYFAPSSWATLYNAANGCHLRMSLFDNTIGASSYVGDATAGFMAMSLLGFGVANGGTDGNATTRPLSAVGATMNINAEGGSAIDPPSYRLWNGGTQSPSPSAHRIHVMVSSDGKVWRFVVCRNNRIVSFMNIDVPQNPVVVPGSPAHTFNGLDKPLVGIFRSGNHTDGNPTLTAMYKAHWYITGHTLGSFLCNLGDNTLVTPVPIYHAGEQVARTLSDSVPVATRGTSSFTGNRTLAPVSYVSLQGGYVGPVGVASDLFWSDLPENGVAEGDYYPGDTSRQMVGLGVFAHPWNQSVMLMT